MVNLSFTIMNSFHTSSIYTRQFISLPFKDDILSQPSTALTLPIERKVAENMVRRLLAESENNTVRIPTRGPV